MACRRTSAGWACVRNSEDAAEKEALSTGRWLSSGELPLCLSTRLAEVWLSSRGALSLPDPADFDSSTIAAQPRQLNSNALCHAWNTGVRIAAGWSLGGGCR